MAVNGYHITPHHIINLVSRLNFTRVTGTAGERRGFRLIQDEVTSLGIQAWFEEFPSPWIEIDRAELQVGDVHMPIEPIAPPAYNGPWMPIPYMVDLTGILVDSVDPAICSSQVLIRTSPDIANPCMAGAAAQLFACAPEEGFVAYYLEAVGEAGTLPPSAYFKPESLACLQRHRGSPCRVMWTSSRQVKVLRNLVAEVRGTLQPDEVIAVGAHMDSFPGTIGADDNASGCARLVEFARWFIAHPPARTVRFIWFTGEELDLRGSHAYVTAHRHDTDRICLYINVDAGVSREHERYPVDVENPVAVAEAARHVLAEVTCATGPTPFVLAAHCSGSTDAAPFHAMGIPAIGAPGGGKRKKTGPSPHLPTDTADQLDPECVLTASVVALAFIDLAQRYGLCQSTN